MQSTTKITLFGAKRLEIPISGNHYLCRYLNPKFLLNKTGLIEHKHHTMTQLPHPQDAKHKIQLHELKSELRLMVSDELKRLMG